jgi:hypothetical protein
MSVLPSVRMSQAILGEINNAGYQTISEIPTAELKEYANIVQAYSLDLNAELARRTEQT